MSPNNSSRYDRDQDEGSSTSRGNADADFKEAMSRLERAVQELVGVTAGQLSDRATRLIDDTSQRIESELRLRRADPDPEISDRRARRRERRRHRHQFNERTDDYRSGKGRLYRDTQDEKIAGVCAGLARYLGMETWVVRMGALTGAVFFPVVVIPAYFVAYFVMGTNPDLDDRERRPRRRRRRRRSSQSAGARSSNGGKQKRQRDDEFTPGRSLRYTKGDVTQAELRLRRLESFVTSKQYELKKEIAKIEREEAAS